MARARATDEGALIRAAAKVFRAKGYRNTTIDDIADAAGISRPTVYSYAKSKRWLLDRIVRDLLDDHDARLRADRESGETPHARLRAVINTHVTSAIVNRTFYSILFSEQSELSPAVHRRFRQWAHRTTADFRDLLESVLDDAALAAGLDPGVAANLIVTMLTDIYRWYDPKGPVKPEQLTEQILLVVGGVLRPAEVA
ncbi:hypothetical protein C1I98_14160 [Spongiactinospora gelatinilytica]|uniref:HTH tetR-type domain-containing protein n=1 Tax=Spongiactinospora gelatinilytica TaxID=2666298 RepID=A0A2W2GVV9_9ACTN|nr:TetR/AcrR family transcriptional regulator [Spongiactinospora gelatinilytica]PZG46669.1 hypothetical protein C1I98_14160 [Spongiactinospora gelatinilytica]